MGLTDDQRQEVNDLSELAVRRYFDHFLEEVLPCFFGSHNSDCKAHGGVVKRLERFKWLLIGLSFGAGVGSGVASAKLFALL